MDSIIQIPNGTHQIAVQVSDPNTLYLAIGTFALVLITLFGIMLSDRRTRRSLAHLEDSNKLTQQSNDLLRTDILARYRPVLQVHNLGIEPLEHPEDAFAQYHPNLRNDGNVEIKNIEIYFKSFPKTLEIIDIIKIEEEIKKHQLPYEGSILPNGVAVVNAIPLPVTNNVMTLVLWIKYKFLTDQEDQIIFNITFEFMRFRRILHYVGSDIVKARNDIKIREDGAPIG